MGWEKLKEPLNKVWKKGKIPESWREGRVKPIYKKGDPDQVANYRGITLMHKARIKYTQKSLKGG